MSDRTDTGDTMDDEQFDRVMREAARHYNAPPPTPSDAMWAAIQARRSASQAAAPRPAMPGAASPSSRAAVAWARRWAPIAAAALLFVGVGVEIGRRWAPDAAPLPAPSAQSVARGPAAPPASSPPAVAAERASSPVEPATRRVAASGARRRDERQPRSAPAPAAPAERLAVRPMPRRPDVAGAAPYRAATAQHLAQVEALLTAFRADGSTGVEAPPDAAWARDLLTTTRLLLDSPAARDPERQRLLEDLELVLVQIVQLPRADTPEERALIDHAIRRGDVLTKLRAAVPAGAATRGT